MAIYVNVSEMLHNVNSMISDDFLVHGFTNFGLGERLDQYGWKNSGEIWVNDDEMHGFTFRLALDDTYALELRDTIVLTNAMMTKRIVVFPSELPEDLVDDAYQGLIHARDTINSMCSEKSVERV